MNQIQPDVWETGDVGYHAFPVRHVTNTIDRATAAFMMARRRGWRLRETW